MKFERQNRTKKSELASSSRFYSLKYHFNRLCIYTSCYHCQKCSWKCSCEITSEPICKWLKKSAKLFHAGILLLPTSNSDTHFDHSFTLFIRLDTKWTLQVSKSSLREWTFPSLVILFMRNRLYLWREV